MRLDRVVEPRDSNTCDHFARQFNSSFFWRLWPKYPRRVASQPLDGYRLHGMTALPPLSHGPVYFVQNPWRSNYVRVAAKAGHFDLKFSTLDIV